MMIPGGEGARELHATCKSWLTLQQISHVESVSYGYNQEKLVYNYTAKCMCDDAQKQATCQLTIIEHTCLWVLIWQCSQGRSVIKHMYVCIHVLVSCMKSVANHACRQDTCTTTCAQKL